MPEGRGHKIYKAMRKKGASKKKAAKVANSKTTAKRKGGY